VLALFILKFKFSRECAIPLSESSSLEDLFHRVTFTSVDLLNM